MLINNDLINIVIKKPKHNHCHILHEENVGLPHSVQAARISSTGINLKKKIESGSDLLSAGPCSEKSGGPLVGAADPIFPGKKLATFLVITVRMSGVSSPQKLATFFCSSLSFTRPLFPACKTLSLLLWALFVGGCSAEHAEHA